MTITEHLISSLKQRHGITVSEEWLSKFAAELASTLGLCDKEIICVTILGKEVFIVYDNGIIAILTNNGFVGDRTRRDAMKLYLDDVRDPPGDDWVVVRDYDSAIDYLKTGKIIAISLDHDLGSDDEIKSGYGVATWIEEQVATSGFRAPKMKCHSANPPGKKRIEQVIKSVEKMARQ